jgi:hypothetical protein
MYTIPGGVQAEAKKALKWRKEHERGGTPVGLGTARRLAEGGQIGIEKIRHIAKYFPRHEVDKKGKGWKPGQENFPSNGRIAWALWGGEAAKRWASVIVERENKKEKGTTAGGAYESGESWYEQDYYDFMSPYDSDISAFKLVHELDPYMGPEFMARVRLDGSGIDRLYKVEVDGQVYLWDGTGWDNMGHVDGDVYSYDKSLDDPEDTVEKDHVLIDPSSAVIVSAFLQERPFQSVTLDEIDPREARLMADGLPSEDFQMIDRIIVAAGQVDSPKGASQADKDGDGKLDSDFLSAKAKAQPKDALGRFVEVGNKVVVGGDYSRGKGEIVGVDQDNGRAEVLLENGSTIEVNTTDTSPIDPDKDRRASVSGVPEAGMPLDLSGIIGEPRTPFDRPKAHLPGTLKPMSQGALKDFMYNWPAYVDGARNTYKPRDAADKKRVQDRYDVERFASTITAAAEEKALTPETSDVKPKYLALVSPDDPRAVMDLVALVPASATSNTPVVYERKDGAWLPNEQILADLKSFSPPPVIALETEEVINDVLIQVDDLDKEPVEASGFDFSLFWEKHVEPILAAGGLDRNRGNAEALRRYWTRGKGALKIRWGTPGDWTRCVRQLSKYMGPRAKGYCQLRHKEATGVYTGSKYNVGKKRGRIASGDILFSSVDDFDSKMLHYAELSARAADAKEKVALVAAASRGMGSKFFIPTLIPEEVESGDGRKFKKNSLTTRDMPVPLLWQIKTGSGHDGSVVVGRIDYIERIEGGMGNAYGVFDSGPYGREAERLVKDGFLRGVSVDLDQFEAKEDKKPRTENSEDGDEIGKDKLTINKARIMAATIVAKPAFQECSIELQNAGDQEDDVTPEDGVYEESMEDFVDVEPMTASGFLKSDIPMTPPADWFKDPRLTKPTPIVVDEDGRIYGHIAAWNVNHIGLPRATKPPRSRSKYAYFHTGVLRTAEGTDTPVGQLTLAGGHAPLNADAASAAKHYDDTASAVADIHVGEDEYGIWCAGSLRPNLDELQIRALRASAPSGDWRPINGSLELVAICQVNVPGFPTARAMVASGKVMALVAAGASHMAMMRCTGAACALSTKADMLGQLSASAPNLRIRVREAKKSLRENNLQALTASAANMRDRVLIAAAIAELANISEEERMKLAKKGHALSDGAYPIRNVEDLKNAIQAYGRSKASERYMVRKHIIKRARSLGKMELIPDYWTHAGSSQASTSLDSMRAAITAAAAKALVAAPEEEEISEEDLKDLREAKEDADKQTEEEVKAAEEVEANRGDLPERDAEGREKYVSGVNQPRDAKGKYRKVLARLKQNLGVAGLSRALQRAEEAQNMDFAGDYAASAAASSDLLGMIDRLDSGALDATALENVRLTAAELGTTLANLPLPFGKDADKLRFSDLPSGLKDLIDNMMTRVEAKIGKEDANIATQKLRAFKTGADVFNQSEIQSEMATMLRLLT